MKEKVVLLKLQAASRWAASKRRRGYGDVASVATITEDLPPLLHVLEATSVR